MLYYHFSDGQVVAKRPKKQLGELRVAFINNYQQACGISTYSEFLINELAKKITDFRIFAEYNLNPIKPSFFPDKTQECWKRGSALDELVKAIDEYRPDIILIQHESGLFPNARHWISLMTRLSSYRVIITMHSVFYHQDKTICEACMPEIIVHLNGAEEVLKQHKKISGKVYVIPHGCFQNEGLPKLWNYYRSDHTFMTQGFSFRYKRFEDCLRATAILKEKYQDVFFTGLLAESPFNEVEHQIYYEELVQLSKDLGIEGSVGLIRGYQSEQVIDSFLRTNKVAVFPYGSDPQHLVFGASGACRIAMSKGIPTISSSIPHFQDLPTIKANSPEEIATQLDFLFSSTEAQQNQIAIQNQHLRENSWEKIAEQYLNVFLAAP